jgi:hypothetical protein
MARNLLVRPDKQVAQKESLKSLQAFARFLTSECDAKDGSTNPGRLYHLQERMSNQFQKLSTCKKKKSIPVQRNRLKKKRLWDLYSEYRSTTTAHSGDLTLSSTTFNRPWSSVSSPRTGNFVSEHSGLSQNPSAPYEVPGQTVLPPWDGLTPLDFLPMGNESYLPTMQEPVIPAHLPMKWVASHDADVGYMRGRVIAYPSATDRAAPPFQDVGNSTYREHIQQPIYPDQYTFGCPSYPAVLAHQIHEAQSQVPTVATMMSTSPSAAHPGEHYPIADNAMSQYSSQFETSLPTPRSFFLSPGPSVVDFNPCEFSKSQMFKQDRF